MQILVPKNINRNWQEAIQDITDVSPLEPFGETVKQFISTLSNRIIRNASFRQYPELMAMAYWLRKAHINQIEIDYQAKRQGRIWLPKGIVLHFAPSNVDTIFIYSWLLSLLVGNSNIIRLSQTRNEQIESLLSIINDIFKDEKYIEIAQRTLVVTYGHDESITQSLSNICNLRVIWGGDETIRTIRRTSLPPRTTEMVFANRFSMSMLNADSVLSTNDVEIRQLASDFYNDSYWFNQMACSSPRLIMWVGEKLEKVEEAKQKFWAAVKKVTEEKKHYWEPAVSINRLVEGYTFATKGLVNQLSTVYSEDPYRVGLNTYDKNIREVNCGGGFFFENTLERVEDAIECFDQMDQTLSIFGFDKDELESMVWRLGGRGIDRVVPIGKALEFHTVWDGYDLLTYFTREVLIDWSKPRNGGES